MDAYRLRRGAKERAIYPGPVRTMKRRAFSDLAETQNSAPTPQLYKEEEEFWNARSRALKGLGESEQSAIKMEASTSAASRPQDGEGGDWCEMKGEEEEVEFIDTSLVVDSLLASRRNNESEESRRQKLQVHEWLLSLGTFRDDLNVIVQKLQTHKGKIAQQRMEEQSIQLQFLDEVVREGKRCMVMKQVEMRNAQFDAKTFMETCARVIYGQAEYSEALHDSYRHFCALREDLSREYLTGGASQSATISKDFYHFFKEVQKGKKGNQRRPLFHKEEEAVSTGTAGTAGTAGGSTLRARASEAYSTHPHQHARPGLNRDFEEVVQCIELRHAKEINEMREKLSRSLDIELESSKEFLDSYPNSVGIYELMKGVAEDHQGESYENMEKKKKGKGGEEGGAFYHEAYRSVVHAIQQSHHREKDVLQGTIREVGKKNKELAAALSEKAALLKESNRRLLLLEERRKTAEAEREKKKVQMIEAMKKMDIIRNEEHKIEEENRITRDEERTVESARAKKHAELRALEKERENERQREREIEALRESQREQERKAEKDREKKLEKENAQLKQREKRLRMEREAEKEAERQAELVLTRKREEERNAELISRKQREMESEFEQRKIAQLEKELVKYREELEKKEGTMQNIRKETEEILEKKFASDLERERERMDREKEKLEVEKEKFYLLNPSRDVLEAKLKSSETEREALRQEMSQTREETETAKEYALYAQRRDYEGKVQEMKDKVTKLATAFKKLPPPSVFEPAPVPLHMQTMPPFSVKDPAVMLRLDSGLHTHAQERGVVGYNSAAGSQAQAQAQARGQQGTYIQLLSDLSSLRSRVSSHNADPTLLGVSTSTSTSSTPSSDASDTPTKNTHLSDGSDQEEEEGDSSAVSGEEMIPKLARRMKMKNADERRKLKEVAAELSSLPLVPNEKDSSAELSSKVVDLVKTINKISPRVWQETAKAASISSTDVLDQLLAKESRAFEASAEEQASENARAIRKAFQIM